MVDVGAVEADRFADPHPGDGQQPDQRAHRRGAMRRRDHARRVDQRQDLAVGVEVGHRPVRALGQQILRDDLVGGSSACRCAAKARTTERRWACQLEPVAGGSVAHSSAESVVIVLLAARVQPGDELG